jgi:hypothetical protein
MTHFTDAAGLLSSAIAIVAISSKVMSVFRMPREHLMWLLAAIFFAVLLPIGDIPLAGYLRGTLGDLSITSLLLLFLALLHSIRGLSHPPDRNILLFLTAFTAIGFYPLALGWGNFDPYRLGYGSYGFLACLLALALLAALNKLPATASSIALGVLAWSSGWYESSNLWDYLLDPMVSIYALVAVTMHGIRRMRSR